MSMGTDCKAVALLGSPRRQGNTHIMAEHVLKGAEAEGATAAEVFLDDYKIRPVGELDDKKEARRDSRSADDFMRSFASFAEADLVVWATPVYWQGMAAQLKVFCDRLSAYCWHPDHSLSFPGKHYVTVCAFERRDPAQHRWITDATKMMAEYLLGVYAGHVYAAGTYEKGEVKKDPAKLQECWELGARTVRKVRSTGGPAG